MWNAVHGYWCGTRVWPTKCKRCGDAVFFFACNCGCRVFFDDLGQPWPIHDCDSSWARGLRRSTARSGALVVELSPGITITRPPNEFAIEMEFVTGAKARRRGSTEDPIKAIQPNGTELLNVLGVLREIQEEADPFRTLRIDESTITLALLGPIAKELMGKITIHEARARKPTASYTAWIPARLLRATGAQRGLTVGASMRGINVMGVGTQWFCDSIDIMD